jgi:hypothetical protein
MRKSGHTNFTHGTLHVSTIKAYSKLLRTTAGYTMVPQKNHMCIVSKGWLKNCWFGLCSNLLWLMKASNQEAKVCFMEFKGSEEYHTYFLVSLHHTYIRSVTSQVSKLQLQDEGCWEQISLSIVTQMLRVLKQSSPVARRNSWGWKSRHCTWLSWYLKSCISFPAVRSHSCQTCHNAISI